jgi:hypothetical protein
MTIIVNNVSDRDKVIEELKNRFIKNWNEKPVKKKVQKTK